ncbi:MAG: hypothetical protein V7642_2815 [Burkholderiales bacterium]
MPPELLNSPLGLIAIVFGIVGAIMILRGIAALLRARPLRFMFRTLVGLLLLSCGALAGGIALGLQGYRAFTHEEVAAHLTVRPLGPQRFETTIRFGDGREAVYLLAGDEVYVDAHVLKWHPYMNMLGLHTAYELDRMGGRYRGIDQEKSAPRTVHSLSQDKPVDLFAVRRRYAFLAPLIDAQYGSATFVPVSEPAEFEVRVSTTGLLMRKVDPVQK